MKLIDYITGPEIFYLGIQEDSNRVFVCRVGDSSIFSHYDICLYSGNIRELEEVKELLRQEHKGEGLHKLCKEHGIEVTALYQGLPAVVEAIADEKEFHEFAETLNNKRVSGNIKAFIKKRLKAKQLGPGNLFKAVEKESSGSIVSMCKLYLQICK